MEKVAKFEWLGVALLVGLVLAGAFWGALTARREVRDGIRRTEVINHKRVLEKIFNEVEAYPLEHDAFPHQYVVVREEGGGAADWYVRARLERSHENEADFDREHNVYFRYVNEAGVTYFDVCGGGLDCGVIKAGE